MNHVAVVSVCGPSRSSLLAGRFPHNVGYVANSATASVAAWEKLQDDTLGTWFTRAGYYTAFMGKYVNGMECDVPLGWHHWGGLTCISAPVRGSNPPGGGGPDRRRLEEGGAPTVRLGGTYNYYNASQWSVAFEDDGRTRVNGETAADDRYVIHTDIHQSTFLAEQAVEQMEIAANRSKPFFIHVTPVMVHVGSCRGPYPSMSDYAFDDTHREGSLTDPLSGVVTNVAISPCPSVRHKNQFAGQTMPRVPSWNATQLGTLPDAIAEQADAQNATAVAKGNSCCKDAWLSERQDFGWRNRSAACVDLDDLIGRILEGLATTPGGGEAYMIFTSDNGYHIGEHHLYKGKRTPYDTDIRLPMYILGPGVAKGEVRHHPT